MRSPAELAAMRETLVREFGRLDVVFANAGVALGTPIGDTDEASYAALMDVNVKGVLFAVWAALYLAGDQSRYVVGGFS